MTKNNEAYPQMRFKGFDNAWEQCKLGDFSDIRDGTHDSPKYISYGHPMVTSKNLTDSGLDMENVSFLTDEDFYEINKRSRVNIGDILFGMIGTIGNPVIVDRDDFAIKNVALIKERNSDPIINRWLLQYLKSPSFNRFIKKENAGGTQKFIALRLIRDMKLRVPELKEQQKIGTFFQQVDDTITLHQRKLTKLQELKQGYLQKLFPKQGEKVPELRFKGFDDAWEQRKLWQISNKVTEKNKSGEFSETLTNSAEYGIISQRDFFDKDISNHKNLDSYYIVRENDFVYNPRISNYAPVGPIKRNKLGRTGVMSPLYYVFRTYDIDTEYLEYYFNTTIWHMFMKLNGDSGARSDRFSIKDSVFKEIVIPYPSNEEQHKIGCFFQRLDNIIALHQRELDLLKEQKKGYLQKMFC